MNIVIPIAGKAQRFIDEGFQLPKPLIMVKDRHMIDWAMDSIHHSCGRLIFIVRRDHINAHSIDKILKNTYGSDTEIVVVDKVTRGSVSTCLLAKDLINNADPLLIYTPDVYFEPQFDPSKIVNSFDGFILTFKANSPAHSYAALDGQGNVIRTAEKEVISHHAAVGVYYFKRGSAFVSCAESMIHNEQTTNGEFYICPLYNTLIQDGALVGVQEVEKMHVLGTPKDLDFFTDNVLCRFGDKPVALCSDHSGFYAKEEAKKVLDKYNIPFVDFGTYVDTDCDHHDFLWQAARQIKSGLCGFGMAFCRTGQGFNIAANKINGIRSALVFDEYTAEYAIRHNCANFLCVPEKYVTNDDFNLMINILRVTTFDGGRHATRIQKVEGT